MYYSVLTTLQRLIDTHLPGYRVYMIGDGEGFVLGKFQGLDHSIDVKKIVKSPRQIVIEIGKLCNKDVLKDWDPKEVSDEP